MDDAEVKALLDDTTPGPWKLRKAYLDDDAVEIVPRKVRGKASPEVGSWAELATVQIEYTDSTPKANARLIAAAPDLARALLDARADGLAAVEALRKERDRFEAALGRACLVGGTTYLIEIRDRLAAELAAAQQREAELRHGITEASDPDFLFGAMDNVNDMDVHLEDFAKAASRAIRSALSNTGRTGDLPDAVDPPCTDCDDTGITHQTERFCSCGAGIAAARDGRGE